MPSMFFTRSQANERIRQGTQCIEHFVAIFCVNSSGGNIPHNVALHQRSVGTMDGDANLGRPQLDFLTGKLQSISKHFIGTGCTMVHLTRNSYIAHKDAISALSGMVKMEAILSHVVLLATSIRRHRETPSK